MLERIIKCSKCGKRDFINTGMNLDNWKCSCGNRGYERI